MANSSLKYYVRMLRVGFVLKYTTDPSTDEFQYVSNNMFNSIAYAAENLENPFPYNYHIFDNKEDALDKLSELQMWKALI